MQNLEIQIGINENLNIYVEKWCAWQPSTGKPELKDVPAMQRRRLGPLARVVFHVLGQCADISRQEPVVFSSLMGEIQRTQSILNDIAADQPVSPASFSLSVHNAISGQWSLIHGLKAPMVALSPTEGSCVAALIEAAGILQEDIYSEVNIVLYEEDYPAFYAPFLKGPTAPTALALRLVTEEQARPGTLPLTLSPFEHPNSCIKPRGPLDLVPLLMKNISYLDIAEPQSNWRLEYSS